MNCTLEKSSSLPCFNLFGDNVAQRGIKALRSAAAKPQTPREERKRDGDSFNDANGKITDNYRNYARTLLNRNCGRSAASFVAAT